MLYFFSITDISLMHYLKFFVDLCFVFYHISLIECALFYKQKLKKCISQFVFTLRGEPAIFPSAQNNAIYYNPQYYENNWRMHAANNSTTVEVIRLGKQKIKSTLNSDHYQLDQYRSNITKYCKADVNDWKSWNVYMVPELILLYRNDGWKKMTEKSD